MLTQVMLKELLHYDLETGLFTWKVPRAKGKIVPGTEAGCVVAGYLSIRVDGRSYQAHRLAHLYLTGGWPTAQIDHINGVRSDNRWANLRPATAQINQENRMRANRNNSTGLLGVTQQKRLFKAQIVVCGKRRHLGYYRTPEEAHAAYLEAKRKLHEGNTL